MIETTTAHQVEESPTAHSTEEILIEKLDNFLSQIEDRIGRFERYFSILSDQTEEAIDDKDFKDDTDNATIHSRNGTRSRASSSASLASIRHMSGAHLNKVYEQLTHVKQLVLANSFKNVGHLYKTLDYQYNSMFFGKSPQQPGVTGVTSGTEDNHDVDEEPSTIEALQGKVITTIHYFEEKLCQIDKLLNTSVSSGALEKEPDNALKYYNFNKALKHAEDDYLHYYQLPLSWRENRYIIHGYRFTMSHVDMVKSMFHFDHNETGNIWSHLIGFFVMSYFAFWHFTHSETFARNTIVDNAIMYVFFASCAKCLVSSVLWHTYLCFAVLPVRARFACVDYTGITVLITCSVISVEYCALYNMPKLLMFFVGFSILCGAGGLFFNWLPYFDKPECRHFRIAFFVGLALLGGTTFLFKWFYEGFTTTLHFFLPLSYKSFLWYWIGVVFYGGLIPERWRYDIIIDEEDSCSHTHLTLDVLSGHIEHSGEEEMRNIEDQFDRLNQGFLQEKLQGVSTEKSEKKTESSETDSAISTGVSVCHTTHAGCQNSGGEKSGECGGVNERLKHKHSGTNTMHGGDSGNEENASDSRYMSIVEKHFPTRPIKTPYHRDFMSLWWVDYFASSHNIWHVFVVFGIIGHYFSLLDMFEAIAR